MLKKLLPSLGLAVLGLLASPAAHAQSPDGPRPCGFDQMQQQYFATHPGAEQDYYRLIRQVAAQAALPTAQRNINAAPDVTVPVVIHILYNDVATNITDRQINNALAVVNEDFSKTNADTSDVIPVFKGRYANVGFQFRLAKIDPNGNCTTGITRTFSSETNTGTANVTNVIYWNPRKYLNIWIVKDIASGAGGYTFGGAAGCPTNDGIVLRSSQFGPNTQCSANLCRRSLTHEIGHYFGLSHTWGGTNTPGVLSNCSLTDNVADTPTTAGYSQGTTINGQTLGSCTLTYSPCRDNNNQPILSNVQNFMDYADCEKMFTEGQKAFMRNVATTSSCRINLVSAANLVATGTNDGYTGGVCAPIANFQPSATSTCTGSTVTLRDFSYNYNAAGGALTYSWSMPGGTPSTATGATVSVVYNTPGFYSITETVSNTVGNNSITRNQLIRVEGAGAGEVAPYTESFEDASFPVRPSDPLRNWELSGVTSAGATLPTTGRIRRTSSDPAADGQFYLEIPSVTAGAISTIITPNIDLSAVPQQASVSFSRFYGLRTATSTEVLRVAFSSDCGVTWVTQATLNASALNTQGTTTGTSQYPTAAADWKPISVPIGSQFQGSPRFKVRFQIVTGATPGNSVLLDAVRVTSPLVSATRAAALAERGISVYPNPLTSETAVHLTLPATTSVQLRLTDVLGREVLVVPAKSYAAGVQSISLPITGRGLKAGVYVLRISLDGEAFTSKLNVQ